MKKINIIGASTLAALEWNLVMTLWPNGLRRAVRWGSSAVGIACLMITTAAGAGETWNTFASGAGVNGPVRAVTTRGVSAHRRRSWLPHGIPLRSISFHERRG